MRLRAVAAAFGCRTRPVLSPPGAGAVLTPRRRLLHLAPPFLLDDGYVPRYQMLSEVDAAKKRSSAYAHLRNCNLCPRRCGVNRYETTGMCLIGEKVKVNVIAPHFGEGKATYLPTYLPTTPPFSPFFFASISSPSRVATNE